MIRICFAKTRIYTDCNKNQFAEIRAICGKKNSINQFNPYNPRAKNRVTSGQKNKPKLKPTKITNVTQSD